MRRDASFGPAVVVGIGGVLTELLDDVAIRLAPVDRDTAIGMLAELRGARILDGVRGSPPVDRGALADLIVALAGLGAARPDIVEVDLNPVIASAEGAVAVDALVVLASPASAAGPRARSMPDEPVLLTTSTPWGVRLTLNRPAKLNALNGELVTALVAALDAAEADPPVRVIVLEGAGRAFSSGYDLTEEAEGAIGGPVAWRERWRRTSRPRSGSSIRPSQSSPRCTATPWRAAWSSPWPATSSSRPKAPSSASRRSVTGPRPSRC